MTTEQAGKAVRGVRKRGELCVVEGCVKTAHYPSGMCAMHHRRVQRKGIVGPPGTMRPTKTQKR